MNEPQPPELPDDRNLFAPLEGDASPGDVLGALLKRPGRIAWEILNGRAAPTALTLAIAAVASLAIYGLISGSLTGGPQFWIAPAKIVIGTVIASAICLPSLYVFLCLNGADAEFRGTAGLLVASAALTAILLVSFGPIVWVFSQSTDSLAAMGILHLLLWGIAASFGLRFLAQSAAHVSGSRLRIGAWIAIYVLVSLQMMTTLRPILGPSEHFLPQEKKFFIAHWLETMSASTER